jgi:hypothetical protein
MKGDSERSKAPWLFVDNGPRKVAVTTMTTALNPATHSANGVGHRECGGKGRSGGAPRKIQPRRKEIKAQGSCDHASVEGLAAPEEKILQTKLCEAHKEKDSCSQNTQEQQEDAQKRNSLQGKAHSSPLEKSEDRAGENREAKKKEVAT